MHNKTQVKQVKLYFTYDLWLIAEVVSKAKDRTMSQQNFRHKSSSNPPLQQYQIPVPMKHQCNCCSITYMYKCTNSTAHVTPQNYHMSILLHQTAAYTSLGQL